MEPEELFSFAARQLGFTTRTAEIAVQGGKDFVVNGAKTVGRLRVKVEKPIDYLSELNALSETEIMTEKRKDGDLVILSADEAKYMLDRE